MARHDTTKPSESHVSDEHTPATVPFGDADVRIDVDADTYEQLQMEYHRAVERGYGEPFATFAYNRCETDCAVTVGGEPVAESLDESDA
jgi:hypothetical protein